MKAAGRYFDGKSGARLDVDVEIKPSLGALWVSHPELPGGGQSWPLADLRVVPGQARDDQIVLALATRMTSEAALLDAPRLTLKDANLIAQLPQISPDLHKRDLGTGTARRVATRLGLAIGAFALMLFVILPALAGTLAQLIPPQREAQWGRTVVTQIERFLGGSDIGQLVCAEPEGKAALTAMLTRLGSGTDLAYTLEVTVFDHDMVNAFAAPGGQIVLMRGLLEAASSADEVAGVLAHEVGHVEARDATRNTLRAAGSAGLISLVLGDFAGGTLAVVLAEATLSASYTREAERAADLFALTMLENANVSSSGLADFFDVISEKKGNFELPEYLSTHPRSTERAGRAEAFSKGQGTTSEVISASEWRALQAICE